MTLRLLLPVLLASAVTCVGQKTSWEKDAKGWLRVDEGNACKTATKVKVRTRGKLSVQSGNRPDVGYAWRQCTAQQDKGQAERRLSATRIKTVEEGEWCVVITSGYAGQDSSPELVVTVPRRIRYSRLENMGGAISAKYLSGDVHLTTSAGVVNLDDIAGNAIVTSGGGGMTIGTVTGSLRCFSAGGDIRIDKVGSEAVLETAGGEIVVREAGSGLRMATAGNIHVDQAAGAVFAHSSGGLIEVMHAGGMVTAENAGGGIQIGAARGVRCESAGGSIRLENVTGSVRAATASGSLSVSFGLDQPTDSSFLATGRGDITVFIPSKLAVTVKALNETSGLLKRVVSEFPEIRTQPAETGGNRPMVAQGSLNGGGPVLMVSATNGSIFLRRGK